MHSNEETKAAQFFGQKRRRKMWKIPFIIAAVVLIKSVVVLYLWNALVPDLFHGPTLTYLQAAGLTILARLLVGGGRRPFGGRSGGPPWRARWHAMSPEEREKLREEIRSRFGE